MDVGLIVSKAQLAKTRRQTYFRRTTSAFRYHTDPVYVGVPRYCRASAYVAYSTSISIPNVGLLARGGPCQRFKGESLHT